MTKQAQPIPAGFHTLTPHIVVKDASKAIEFYKKAFGAQEIRRVPGPDGNSLIHAEVQIGDSRLMLVDEFPAVTIHMYVKDVDAVFNKAVAAGAEVKMPLDDMFWGDRYGALTDPFGHSWSLATHKEDPTPEEIPKRSREAFAATG
jgi:PhnB protein